MKYFLYGNDEMAFLRQRDKLLGAAIAKIGFIRREVEPDIFKGLVNSIISQQIPSSVATLISERLLQRAGDFLPVNMASLSAEDIKSVGMSMKKALWIKRLAEKVLQGEINLNNLNEMTDDEVIKTLTSLDGIGKWSAEMLMIFSLGRKDVLSINDFGIKKGVMHLYNLKELPRGKELIAYKERYSPYGSIASFYLWEIARINKNPH